MSFVTSGLLALPLVLGGADTALAVVSLQFPKTSG